MISLFRKEELYPWAGKPSIYETIRGKIQYGRLQDDKLPDDEEYWAGQPFRWVAGGIDGAFGHHAVGGQQETKVNGILKLLAKQSRKPGIKTRRPTYMKLMQEDLLSFIDPLLEALRRYPGIDMQNLYYEAYWFAEQGVHQRLQPETSEIKGWLLRHGCRNSVMNAYLAYTCAVKGELHVALADNPVISELYEGAGEILSALITGGPAKDIDDYEHAPFVLGQFLRLSNDMTSAVRRLGVIIDILGFLNQEEIRWQDRYAKGWTVEMRNHYRLACEEILSRPAWPEKIWTDLRSGEQSAQYTTIQAARTLNMDVWPELFRQLEQDPLNGSLYFELMRTDDTARVKVLADFAERTLPLSDIASGPADEMGLGPDFAAHSALDFILQDLDRHVGIGRKLIETALQSPVVRNRNLAVKALEAWPIEDWGTSLIADIGALAEFEPDESLQTRVRELMLKKGI